MREPALRRSGIVKERSAVKIGAATIVASLMWTACSAGGQVPAAGQTFSLRAGESVPVGDGILRVGFEGVTADSRCPKGEQCVWAGDATVRVWLQRGTAPRQTVELHTAPGPAQAARSAGHELRLLRLEPYPVAGRPVAKGDAVATLSFGRSTPADPER